MKKLLTIIFTLTLSFTLWGQTGAFNTVVQAGGSGKDYAYDIAVDTLGNKYITGKYNGTIDFGSGVTISPVSNFDGYVAKYDKDDNIVWAKTFGGGLVDEGNAVAVDEDGNVIVAGVLSNKIVLGTDTLTSTGNFDIAIIKFDANGNYLWMNKIYSHSGKQDKARDIAVDSQGNYIITGYYGDNELDTLQYGALEIESHGERDAFVIKIDANGSPLWGVTAGGADKEEANALALDENDDVYITGFFNSDTSTFGTTELLHGDKYDVFIAKISSAGEYQWAKALVGAGDDKGYALTVIPGHDDGNGDGNGGGGETGQQRDIKKDAPMLIMAGSFSDSLFYNDDKAPLESVGKKDMFVLGIDSESGEPNIALQFGGEADDEAKAIEFIPESDGSWYLAGISSGDMVLPTGTLLNYGSKDAVIFHMNQENFDWAKNYGGSSIDYLNSAAVAKGGEIYFTGNFKSTSASFEPATFTNNGGYDIWFGKMREAYSTVNFFVGMNAQIESGEFDPNTGKVFVIGDFQKDAGDPENWGGTTFEMERFSREENDEDSESYFYMAVVKLPADSAGKRYEYKYVTNTFQESIDNRSFTLEPFGMSLFAWFNNDDGHGPRHLITFEVDMNVQIDSGKFNTTTDVVSFVGDMNRWRTGVDIMTDSDADGVYSISIELPEEYYEFRFAKNDRLENLSESRSITVGNSDSTYTAFYDNDSGDVVGIEKIDEIPTIYELGQNYPNPFNPSTLIKFAIPTSGLVSLKIFNILGEEVATLVNEVKPVGIYQVSFNASNLTTGMYIYRLQSGNFTATKKMLLIK